MPARKAAQYGSWRSPITPEVLATGSALPTELTIDGRTLYWLELRPDEQGRYALCRLRRDGRVEEVVPSRFNVRTKVHEYGGGSYFVRGQMVYFSNFSDQLVYRLEMESGEPVPITKPGLRYSDYVLDGERDRLIAVCEDHTAKGRLPTNCIVGVATDGPYTETLISGNDFYSSPRIDPTGRNIAWVTWNFPNMSWDGTELWTGALASDGEVVDKRLVAGGVDESVLQPEWSPDGMLYFISDRTGFWNIYRWREEKVERVSFIDADVARPEWVFRISNYAFLSEKSLVFNFVKEGVWRLGTIEIATMKIKRLKAPYTYVGSLRTADGSAYFLGGTPTETISIVQVKFPDGKFKTVRRTEASPIPEGFVSVPRHVQFGTTKGKKAYGFLYGPTNSQYRGPSGEKPPLIVISHGGPTSQAPVFLNPGIQVWTSRGFAVLDVNYGGSTGYGREYRERLAGNWGVVDVDDCCNGALGLAKKGLVDGKRLIIRGGSAGGYTTLCALAFRKVFDAGASYFGISDMEALIKDTHKFEAHYNEALVAPLPEGKKILRARSPIHFPDKISAPVIFFQGLEDVIVPPSQAETMVNSLRSRGIPVAYIAFEGEQHGFRKAENIKRAFEAELYFYSKVFGFKLPGYVEPVEIWNLRRGN